MNIMVFSSFIHLVIVGVIALFVSIYTIEAIFAIKRHNFGRSISLTWGIELNKRIWEIILLGIGAIIFAIHFLLAILNITSVSFLIAVSIMFMGVLGYALIGYFIYRSAILIRRL